MSQCRKWCSFPSLGDKMGVQSSFPLFPVVFFTLFIRRVGTFFRPVSDLSTPCASSLLHDAVNRHLLRLLGYVVVGLWSFVSKTRSVCTTSFALGFSFTLARAVEVVPFYLAVSFTVSFAFTFTFPTVRPFSTSVLGETWSVKASPKSLFVKEFPYLAVIGED